MKRLLCTIAVCFFAVVLCHAQYPARKTVREFLRMSKKDTTTCLVTGVVDRVSSVSGGNLYITDGTGTLYIYGVRDSLGHSVSFRSLDVRKGDTVSFQGRRILYHRTVEMVAARLMRKADGPDHNAPVLNDLDRQPSFKGQSGRDGLAAFCVWVENHVNYPQEAVDAGVSSAHVTVRFVVGRNGHVMEVEILHGSHPSINSEVMRVMNSAPKWKPGRLGDGTVRVTYTVGLDLEP